MNLYDLIAVTATRQILHAELRKTRCGGLYTRRPAVGVMTSLRMTRSFSAGGVIHGQKLSRFLEIVDADVTLIVRGPSAGEVEIEIIPNSLLPPKDYAGKIFAGVECKAISDFIKTKIASFEHKPAEGELGGRVAPLHKIPPKLFFLPDNSS